MMEESMLHVTVSCVKFEIIYLFAPYITKNGAVPWRPGGQDHHWDPPKRRGCRVSAVGNLRLSFSFGATSTTPPFYNIGPLLLSFLLSRFLHANHTQFDPCPFSNDVATSTLTESRLTITTPMSTRTSVYALSVRPRQP